MFEGKWIPTKLLLVPLLLAFLSAFPVSAQTAEIVGGVFVAEGTGTGTTQAEAEEAARLDAANNVVFKEMRRDSVYRDLFVPEAFKNDWFDPAESKKAGIKKWTSVVSIRVDEGLAEALYLGRYSTSVGALLDAAEEALVAIRALQTEGGTAESNGELGSAESAYRRAESKAVETMRFLGPVEDAVFFSSTGNRKAPELKALVVAAKEASADGISRIRSVQERLAMDAEARNVLELLDSVEADLVSAEEAADALHPLATAPRSYETRLLRDSRDRGLDVRESLERRRGVVKARTAPLPADMTYPRTRAELLLDRIDTLDLSLKVSISAISSELSKRTPTARIAAWTFGHEPRDYLSLGVLFPFGLSPRSGGTAGVKLPVVWDARAEGIFPMGTGGFWGRTRVRIGDEDPADDSDSTFTQGVDIGFYRSGLFGVGLRWDWLREDADGTNYDSIPAIAVTIGSVGEDGGETTLSPLWTATAAWEFPDSKDEDSTDDEETIPIRMLNLALDLTLRPSSWIRLDADASARTRTWEGSDRWIGSVGVGFGFRLPMIKPLLWRLRWEGSAVAPILLNEIQRDYTVRTGAFRFGLEYTF